MFNNKSSSNTSATKGNNGARSNVIGSAKGGAFVIKKSKHHGHH